MKKIIFLIMMSFFVVTSCKTAPKIIYKYVDKEVYCVPSSIPIFPDFNYDLPLDSPENIEILLEMLNLYKKYVKDLHAEIKCYEDQTNKKQKKIKDLKQTKKNIDKYIAFLEKELNKKV